MEIQDYIKQVNETYIMRKAYTILLLLLLCQISFAQGLEIPAKLKGTHEIIIQHKGYTLSYNSETNNPNWVAWVLTLSFDDIKHYIHIIYALCETDRLMKEIG